MSPVCVRLIAFLSDNKDIKVLEEVKEEERRRLRFAVELNSTTSWAFAYFAYSVKARKVGESVFTCGKVLYGVF